MLNFIMFKLATYAAILFVTTSPWCVHKETADCIWCKNGEYYVSANTYYVRNGSSKEDTELMEIKEYTKETENYVYHVTEYIYK